MNEYGFIDYRRPAVNQNDYRTSTYRANIHLTEQTAPQNAGELKNVCTQFLPNGIEQDASKSEFQESYTFKPTDPTVVRNPTVTGVKYIKSYDDAYLRNAPKPMKPPSSVSRRDYQFKSKSYEDKPPVLSMRTAVEQNSGLVIHRGKPGYAKYLDPSSTTTNLAYMPYTTQQLTIAAKDNITYWSWKKEKKNAYKIKESMCDVFRSSECPKRHAEFASTVKCVPNSGRISTTKLTYVSNPVQWLNFDISHIKSKLMSVPEPPMKADTENKIYGSGKPVRKYVG